MKRRTRNEGVSSKLHNLAVRATNSLAALTILLGLAFAGAALERAGAIEKVIV